MPRMKLQRSKVSATVKKRQAKEEKKSRKVVQKLKTSIRRARRKRA